VQPFTCPQCAHTSTFDPRVETARCPQCGYVPSRQMVIPLQHLKAQADQRKRNGRARMQTGTHQPFLDELLSLWQGTHTPDPGFELQTAGQAHTFFQQYQRALGEDPLQRPGAHMRFVRSYIPEKQAILWFVAGYRSLRRGDRAGAARHFRDLTRLYPEFVDAWVWLTATIDDPEKRIDCLEEALLLESAHPLARDAMAIARGRVSPDNGRSGQSASGRVVTAKCPQCGGTLQHRPGAGAVKCPYCDHQLALQETNLLEGEARLVGDLRLQRRVQGQPWDEVQRVTHCQSCGAELTMTRHLARQCVFCGSSSVLVQDNDRTFEQPDGLAPFQIDKEQAIAAIQKAQRSTVQRLKSWWAGQERKIQEMKAAYLPFWVFDGFVEVRQPVGLPRFPADPAANPTLSRELMMFNNLLFSGVDFPPASLLQRLFPFALEALVPYEPQLLAGWPAVLYRVDVEDAVEQAYDLMLAKAFWKAGPLITAQSSDGSRLRRTFQVTSATYQLVLLPLWLALVQRTKRFRLALVNGQTGKVVFSPGLTAKTA
jgi:hypothetical protein